MNRKWHIKIRKGSSSWMSPEIEPEWVDKFKLLHRSLNLITKSLYKALWPAKVVQTLKKLSCVSGIGGVQNGVYKARVLCCTQSKCLVWLKSHWRCCAGVMISLGLPLPTSSYRGWNHRERNYCLWFFFPIFICRISLKIRINNCVSI